MKKVFGFLLFSMLTLLPAAEKAAYLNMEKVFEGYYKTIQENLQFELQKQNFEERLSLLRDEFQTSSREAQKLEKEARNDLFSQEARDASKRKLGMLMERLQLKREELMTFRQEGYQNLQGTRNTVEETLIKDLTEQVKNHSREKGYTHVYEVSGRSLNRIPMLMVYPEEQEITADILQLVNLGHETELTEAKQKYDDAKARSKTMEEKNATEAK